MIVIYPIPLLGPAQPSSLGHRVREYRCRVYGYCGIHILHLSARDKLAPSFLSRYSGDCGLYLAGLLGVIFVAPSQVRYANADRTGHTLPGLNDSPEFLEGSQYNVLETDPYAPVCSFFDLRSAALLFRRPLVAYVFAAAPAAATVARSLPAINRA
jgi:hypothetical protein